MLTEEQRSNRKKGIGASEIATIMGFNPSMSPYQLWCVKTGRIEAEDLSQIPCVYWGTVHEENIANEYARQMQCEVEKVPETLYHKDYPFILCHLDRKIKDQDKSLECKFAMFARDDWGKHGTDIVPMSYILQVQHQLAVTGYEEADLAVLISGFDFRIYHFKRDEEIIAKIIEAACEFWNGVETDTPPELRDRTDVALAFPRGNGNLKQAESNIINIIEKIRNLKSQAKMLDTEKDKLETTLTNFIQDADGICIQDQILATWKANARGSRVLRIMEAM